MALRYPEIKYAATHNAQGSLVSIETLVKYPPRVKPVPLGVPQRVLSKRVIYDTGNGRQVIWRWGFMSMTDLNALVVAFFGNWDTSNADMTIRTLKRAMTYGNYNVIAHLPIEEQDYVQETTTDISDLKLTFDILAEI